MNTATLDAPPTVRPDTAMTTAPATVPAAYHGVWARTLLETPEGRDTTTWVRWVQTSRWHGDLRVPPGADRRDSAGLALQQGFGGITEVQRATPLQAEVCTWHRQVDLQPPRPTPDAGHMTFQTPDRVIETGVHGRYLEVWERLPGSLGRRIALARRDAAGRPTDERLLFCGRYLMHLRPRACAWPADLRADDTLHDLVERHPDQATALLDFVIAFGAVDPRGEWHIERASLPALEGTRCAVPLERMGMDLATVSGPGPLAGAWEVLEWSE